MGEWLFFTFALTGRRNGEYGTQGVALGYELAGLSARAWPLTIVLWTCWAIARAWPLTIGLWTCWAFSPCLAAYIVASALKGQPVHSPGQRPGYQCIIANAL